MKGYNTRRAPKKPMMAPQEGGFLSMSFSDVSGKSLNLFALLALFLSGLVIMGLGIYYMIVYKRAKGEVPKKVQTLGIVNMVVGIFAILFSASAFFFM